MREIKFRAWDAFQEEMLDGSQIILDFIGQPHQGEVAGFVEYEEDQILRRREVTLMQFTGLHDKNGVPIWEGDVLVDVSDSGYFNGKKWQVMWFQKECRFGLVSVERDLLPDANLDEKSVAELEVLGNVHEHSHLLERK